MLRTVIVIPARYGSTRFPGKPLVPIAGKTLLERVWRIGVSVSGVSEVLVATDDERIVQHAGTFGARVVMTDTKCRNGTERVHQALHRSGVAADVVINLQGDAPLTPPWILEAMVQQLFEDPAVLMSTPCVQLSGEQFSRVAELKSRGEVGGTFVTFDLYGNALYFSKSIIPFVRNQNQGSPVYKHIGVYAYRSSTLDRYVTLPQTPFEAAEELEQLRALEHGIPIRVVQVDLKGRTLWSVDSPADRDRAEEIVLAEGELA